ncbi:MAG: hypothetical protein ACR652_17860 [Methylocystis sp.]|uniref:hypothetical protein n=1 Tax=Methylocystis sp. TaxID=1911079 RepID=UPI003DA44375
MNAAAESVRAALEKRYQAPEWSLLFEVGQGTGTAGGRYADAVAMNLFPSRGLRVEGVEIKISRGDWLRELRDPAKSEPIQRFCDHWWIATTPEIVLPGELPPTWGLIELKGGCMRVKVNAPKLEPEPLGRPFLAAMLRRATEKADKELRRRVREETEAERARIDERVRREVEVRTNSHKNLQRFVEEFEEASGLLIDNGWRGGKEIGEAVKLVTEIGLTSLYGGVRGLGDHARKLAEKVDALLASLPASEEDEAA